MPRAQLLAVMLLAAASVPAMADEQAALADEQAGAETEYFGANVHRDGFVMMSDACGASRYAHLIGRDYGEVIQAALLPSESVLHNPNMLRTLEYTPHKLNVAVGRDGVIIAIGCF